MDPMSAFEQVSAAQHRYPGTTTEPSHSTRSAHSNHRAAAVQMAGSRRPLSVCGRV
ncbi:hypothetical protein CONLIGDRAFT_637565 [Coniochaeta ligniaria NRRL 30616]|uniref:Uncharacterized protein n=1 Tax=Coniochaeta ligniaria NRRL 30616 TaxID=1408157 RepID=A0A1J7I7X3_9PEZI|nr:hypothetical protein CONLIGDRAFT_637565 [Coniochaeta ligniaria NRRL 30616]